MERIAEKEVERITVKEVEVSGARQTGPELGACGDG
jgi:hypothetical protein